MAATYSENIDVRLADISMLLNRSSPLAHPEFSTSNPNRDIIT
jgi:ubiquitin-activating enzyme E1 C